MTSVPVPPAAKPATTRRKAAAKPAVVVETPAAPVIAAEPAAKAPRPEVAGTLRLKELVEQVTAATGGKKKGVKEIVEATLAQLGLTLDKGHALNLPGLGKVRIARQAQGATGGAMTLKLRRDKPGAGGEKPGKQALAAANDQG